MGDRWRFEVDDYSFSYGPTVVQRDEDGCVERVWVQVPVSAFDGPDQRAKAHALAEVICERLPQLLKEARRRFPMRVIND